MVLYLKPYFDVPFIKIFYAEIFLTKKSAASHLSSNNIFNRNLTPYYFLLSVSMRIFLNFISIAFFEAPKCKDKAETKELYVLKLHG